MSREENLTYNSAPISVHTLTISTTAQTIERSKSLRETCIHVTTNVIIGIRFDNAVDMATVIPCDLLDGGTRHMTVGSESYIPIPRYCTFISIIGAESGVAYIEQMML